MKSLTSKEIQALRHIRNWVMHHNRTPSVRELMQALGYKSPRSAQDVIEQLADKGFVRRLQTGSYQLLKTAANTDSCIETVDVPVVGHVAAGTPMLAQENIEAFLPISTALAKPGGKYFLLKIRGDSMNRAGISDGDFVLVRQQPTADAGAKVVALIDDEATVKTYHPGRDVVVLKPHSTNPAHKPIVVEQDLRIQGVVVKTIQDIK